MVIVPVGAPSACGPELPVSWTSARAFHSLCEEWSHASLWWLASQGVPVELEEPRRAPSGKRSRKARENVKLPLYFPVPPMIDYHPGVAPIIMSAPHAGRETVPGCPCRSGRYAKDVYVKPIIGADGGTWEMCALACQKASEIIGMPVPFIRSVFARKHADLNRGPLDPHGNPHCLEKGSGFETPEQKAQWQGYHDMLRRTVDVLVSHYGFCLVIDLHSNRRQSLGLCGSPITDCLTRGTRRGKSTQEMEDRYGVESITGPHSLFGQLDSMGYTVEPPLDLHPSQEATYMGGFITEHYGSLPNVYAMQIEVGAGYRGLEERITQTGVDIGQAMGHFFTHFFKEVL